jgi:hypothetical protein
MAKLEEMVAEINLDVNKQVEAARLNLFKAGTEFLNNMTALALNLNKMAQAEITRENQRGMR